MKMIPRIFTKFVNFKKRSPKISLVKGDQTFFEWKHNLNTRIVFIKILDELEYN